MKCYVALTAYNSQQAIFLILGDSSFIGSLPRSFFLQVKNIAICLSVEICLFLLQYFLRHRRATKPKIKNIACQQNVIFNRLCGRFGSFSRGAQMLPFAFRTQTIFFQIFSSLFVVTFLKCFVLGQCQILKDRSTTY